MDSKIKDHLQYLNRYYLLLRDARKIPREQFLRDDIVQASSERFLQLAIESCLNIGNRLISLHQFEKPIQPPETYADIFKSLEHLGVVDKAFSERLIQMAKFRNRLVHLYWDLDKEAEFRFIQDNIEDFKLFQDQVVAFLKGKDENREP